MNTADLPLRQDSPSRSGPLSPIYSRKLDLTKASSQDLSRELTDSFPSFGDLPSLASFIRQLSYYSFKRLSDRRRSAERRSHSPSLIVFTSVELLSFVVVSRAFGVTVLALSSYSPHLVSCRSFTVIPRETSYGTILARRSIFLAN